MEIEGQLELAAEYMQDEDKCSEAQILKEKKKLTLEFVKIRKA